MNIDFDMITFGYKNRLNGPLRAAVAIAIGVVMVASKANALELAVQIIAALLVASGLVSFIYGYMKRQDGAMSLMSFNAVVDIVLGVLIFLFPSVVANLIIYIVGFILLGFGIFQIITLISASRVSGLGIGSFILPAIVTLAGGFLVARPSFVGEAIGVFAGAALIVFGVSELLSSWKMRKAMDEYEVRQAPEGKTVKPEDVTVEVKDVDYEKVDEQ